MNTTENLESVGIENPVDSQKNVLNLNTEDTTGIGNNHPSLPWEGNRRTRRARQKVIARIVRKQLKGDRS